MIETIPFTTEEAWLEARAQDVTSTESPALIGQSPYLTTAELFYLKSKRLASDFEANARTIWGQRLQDSIAAGIAEDQGWQIRPMKEYIRDAVVRAGASFDFAIGDDGILEIKNVDSLAFKEGWIVDGDDVQAPVHIECQLQQQLWLSGRKYAFVGALVGGNKVVLIRREPDLEAIEILKHKISQFWFAVGAGIEPVLDPAKDAELICRLFQYAEPGKVLNMQHDDRITELAAHHKQLGETIKQLEAEREGVKAQLLMSIGDAEKVLCNGFTITAGLVGPKRVEYDRQGYRMFRVNWNGRTKKQ